MSGFFNAYLFGWLFWLGLSLGGMSLTMIHHLTGGKWGVLLRPITLSAARVLPLMGVLGIPILFGLPVLFPWARAATVEADPIIRHVHSYLNPEFFVTRYVIYFVAWTALIWGLASARSGSALRRISAGGLVAYAILMTLAGVDWIMSRQAHWVSSVFGFIMVISQTLSSLCLCVVVLWRRSRQRAVDQYAKPEIYNDLGNMLLMFLILWAYMNFSQYLITWTGNEQADIGWYVQRTYGGWRVVAGILIFIHFMVPLFLLLMRGLKRDIRRLGTICAALLALRVVDLYWNIGPQAQTDPHGGFVISPLDAVCWILIGAVWCAVFAFFLRSAPLLALPEGTEGGLDDASRIQPA